MTESSTGGLFNPYDIGQVRPCPVVLDGQIRAVLPQERSILLQEALETGAAGSSVQPDCDKLAQ
jgi:hypothetical protein